MSAYGLHVIQRTAHMTMVESLVKQYEAQSMQQQRMALDITRAKAHAELDAALDATDRAAEELRKMMRRG